MEIVRRGAEAEIRRGEYLGRKVMVKSRVPKAYRHPDLDCSLRMTRTKNEARLMQEARRHGVPTPIIYDIDPAQATIVMQEIVGPRVKDVLVSAPREQAEEICLEIGRQAAALHKAGMVHGDLTTSNMVMEGTKVYLIDFSLGSRNAEIEEMGVDMHLLKEAFQSAHSERFDLFEVVMRSYSEHFDRAKRVLAKIKEIEERGRYT
ncbi:MAG: Kae1-associated serine/threonine protein kinase [Methanomassiliicoccales archaeon]|nr:Kae1-associated serine/threonine protein kinase [Methanomassiliicoccales archaeon]